MTLWMPLLLSFALAVIVLTSLLWVGQRRQDMGFADVGWAASMGLAAILTGALLTDAPAARRVAVAGLAVLWAARLTGYMLRHRVRQGHEDSRYRALRAHWGPRANRYIPLLFLAQTLFVPLFIAPVLVAIANPAPLASPWALAGFAVGLLAIAGEGRADAQLARFRAVPANRGRTCRAGLWRYSRHPNYFFEWLHWWAYVLLAVGAPLAWVAWLGPALMALFLFKLTGIPFAERQALASRGDDYRRYQAATSCFFPWFPRPEAVSSATMDSPASAHSTRAST